MQRKGHPLAVSNAGIKVPSKNASNKPVVYGDGISSRPEALTDPSRPTSGIYSPTRSFFYL